MEHSGTSLFSIFSLLFSSCATKEIYISDVSRFHRLPLNGGGETFSITTNRGETGIEASQHLSRIAHGFVAYGWNQTNSDSADYSVLVDYGI